MTSRRLAVLSSLLALAASCGPAEPPPPAAVGGSRAVETATAGTLSGRVSFSGIPPAVTTVDMSADPACVPDSGPNQASDAVLVGPEGGVQNAFVYLKGGLDAAYGFDVPTEPVMLDQRGCRYVPRVAGVMTGQPFEIRNSDPTLHNVHALTADAAGNGPANLEFNEGMALVGMQTTKTFMAPEVMIRIRCNVHNWMAAYVGVLAHPFFAVTGPDGSFEITGLPPGDYTVGVWHERFGEIDQPVSVGDAQTQIVEYTYESGAAGP